MNNTTCFGPAHILLPETDIPVENWACVACDQFTSDPAYWEAAYAQAGDTPSALRLILPEAFLGAADEAQRVEKIHACMKEYEASVLTRSVDGFVYVERTLQSGRVRCGLVGCIDLEAYSYEKGALPAIRPSEATVVSRIPPRLAVRRGAELELPHVMMLADDPGCTLVEPVTAVKSSLPLLYEGELMQGGGHIAGYAVENPDLIQQIVNACAAFGAQETFDARYPAAAGSRPLTLAVGDGNHSLATAKAYWEELKPSLTEAQRENHPARFCLAEVCNVQSDAIEIEPIHRAFFGTNLPALLMALSAYSDANGLGLRAGSEGEQCITLIGRNEEYKLCFRTPAAPLTVGTVEAFVEQYIAERGGVTVDYIHDEPALRGLCAKGAVGILLPEFQKSDLFRGVVLGGVLPRKTFSMGHAAEKRYYLEARRIAE